MIMPDSVLHTLSAHGHWAYVIIFLAPFLESSAFMGLIIPGESVVLLSGFLAAQGYLNLEVCMALIALGAVMGDSVGYTLGRFFGERYFGKHDRLLLFTRRHLQKVQAHFERHGGATVFWGRLVHLLRVMAPFTAGMSRMPYGKFALYNIMGGTLWAVAYTLLGYFFGQSWQLVVVWAGRAGAFVLFMVLVAAGFAVLFRKLDAHHEEILAWVKAVPSSPLVIRFRARHPELAAFIKTRLSPSSYLGLHLTVGLLICMILVWVFGDLAEDVLSNDSITVVDAWVNAQVLFFRSKPANLFALVTTQFGGVAFVVFSGALITAGLAFRRHFGEAAGFAAAILGGELLNALLKAIVQRPRPSAVTALIYAHGWSFPSGHAMMSATFYGMIAYLLVKRFPSWRVKVFFVTLACFMAFIIGFSRIYLQVHYLSDVLAGFTAGLFWLTVCITGMEVYELKKASARVSQDK